MKRIHDSKINQFLVQKPEFIAKFDELEEEAPSSTKKLMSMMSKELSLIKE